MTPQLAVVAIIIIAAGLLGGAASYLASPSESGADARRLWRYLVLGVIAAGAVPLFLSLVRSEVTREMLGPVNREQSDYPERMEAYLIFVGICLLAAFSARRFIDGVSTQLLQRLDQVEFNTRNAVEVAADAREVAAEIVNEVEGADAEAAPPPEVDGDMMAEASAPRPPIALSAEELAALKAATRRTYRSRTGIAEDAGISRNRISEILDTLYQKKLVAPTKSPTTGGARWTITTRGTSLLSES